MTQLRLAYRETGLRKAQRDTKGKTQTRQMTEQKHRNLDVHRISQMYSESAIMFALGKTGHVFQAKKVTMY